MENKNILKNEEKEILYVNFNKDFKNLNEYGETNVKIKEENEEYSIEYYEVLTDGDQLWVSMDDLVKICKGFDSEQLVSFDFKPYTVSVSGISCICVSVDFLNFIKNNTYAPKYVPQLVLLKERERENNVETHKLPPSLVQKLLVNGDLYIDCEESYEKSR